MAQRKRPTTQSAISLTHPNAAGIDIGSAAHFVAVPPDRDDEPVREFASFTTALSFDPANLATSKLDVVIPLAGASTGNDDRERDVEERVHREAREPGPK